MTNAEVTAAKQRVIGKPFKPGQSGNPAGRPRGSRNRLADAFISDLRDAWEKHGVVALELCATTEPATFCKIIAGLMPKTIDLNVAVDVADFATKFRTACELLGNPETPRLRRPLRNQPLTIEHDNAH